PVAQAVLVLLEAVGDPAGAARDREHRLARAVDHAHRLREDAQREIDVRVGTAGAYHHVEDALRGAPQLAWGAGVLDRAEQDGSARIGALVDRVAEPGPEL